MGRVRYFGIKASGAIRMANNTLIDGETIVIGGKVYEWDDNAAVAAGSVLVTIGGDVAASIVNLMAAINGNKPVVPVTATADPVDALVIRLIADAQGDNGNLTLVETVADAGHIVSGATMLGGDNAGSQIVHHGEHIVTALDVLAANVVIPTGLVTPEHVEMDLRAADGTFREDVTGELTIVAGNLLHGFEGATDLVAGDRLIWQAWE